jgi:GT2 family glycosyltransferase
MVRSVFPQVRLIRNVVNEGFAAPNNTAMRAAEGRFFFLLNSDAELTPGALAKLVQALESDPAAAAAGPRLVFPDGTLQRSARGFPSLWTHLCDMLFLDRLFPRSRFFGAGEAGAFDYDRSGTVDHLMAAAFLIRRDAARRIGLLDERFRIYYNDMDWCYRAVRGGWSILYVHDATVVHHLGKTVEAVNRDFARFEELHDNTMLFFRKHRGGWTIPVYKLLLAGGFLLRTVGWGVIRLVRPSDRSRLMWRFSVRTLLFAARFWRPLPVAAATGERRLEP